MSALSAVLGIKKNEASVTEKQLTDIELAYLAGRNAEAAHFTLKQVKRLVELGFNVKIRSGGFGSYQVITLKEPNEIKMR